MNLTIVIVNYCTAAMAVDCLTSLAAERARGEPFTVVLLDNASPDDSATLLKRTIARNNWGKWVDFISAPRNDGFACGNNVAIRHILGGAEPPAYVILLNPDTAVLPGAIEALVQCMDKHPESGICGARLLDEGGRPQCSGFRFPSVRGELENGARLGFLTKFLRRWVVSMPLSEVPTRVDWVSGACFLIRREVLADVGLLDEAFFMYYEEVDYCRRAGAAGVGSVACPAGRSRTFGRGGVGDQHRIQAKAAVLV